MRILVITMVCGRLDVSSRYVPTLREKAGRDFDHVVVDNGSDDGSGQWFANNGYETVRVSRNVGITEGWRIGWDIGRRHNPDLVIRMDDDCLVETDNVLAEIERFYEEQGVGWIVSPMDLALLEPENASFMPVRIDERTKLGNWNVRISTHSGMFVCAPRKAFETVVRAGIPQGDLHRGAFWRKRGWPTAYLTDLHARHMGRGRSVPDGSYVY